MAMLRHIKTVEQVFFEWAERKGARFIGKCEEERDYGKDVLFLFYIENKDKYYASVINFEREGLLYKYKFCSFERPGAVDGTGVFEERINAIIDMYNARIQISEATAISNAQKERSQSL